MVLPKSNSTVVHERKIIVHLYLIVFMINKCYDSSYAPSLVAMLMTMLVAILRAIADRSPLGHRLVPKPTLFRVSLCSPESYR